MRHAYQAMKLAADLHMDQPRKYTGNPYWEHLAEVAGIVATVAHSVRESVSADEMIATAWLHDVLEDVPGVTERDLIASFNDTIARGVALLSDLEQGNRAERKRLSRERLSAAPGWVQTIKVADIISNTGSIVQHDPKFAVVYLEEKRLLLNVLNGAHAGLVDMARRALPTES